jgi:uncharacterized membrane protein
VHWFAASLVAKEDAMASQALNRNHSNGLDPDQRLARNLGWFSIGLGVTEILAPELVAKISGAPNNKQSRTVIRTYGGREIAQGMAILSSTPRPAGWMWGRVAGDVLDIGSVAVGMSSRNGNFARGLVAIMALLGVTAIDYYCADKLSSKTPATGTTREGRIRIVQSIIVGRGAEEVYRFWRNLENLPRFMKHLESVKETGHRQTHWKTKAPGGSSVEWDAEITADEPNRRISWRSLPGSTVENSGTVSFERATGDRGTLIRVEMEYRPPFGMIGSVAASLFRENPKQQIYDDLRIMKQFLEVGEKAHSDASIFPTMHAAQPPSRVPETALVH